MAKPGLWRRAKIGDGCWEWTGARLATGYGSIGKNTRVHRSAWEDHHGKAVPSGMVIMHTCDNRLCVRPGHLKLGTQGDNLRDMSAKGRACFGERNGTTSLLWDDVEAMRIIRETRGTTYQKLADAFGVSLATAWNICNHVTWKERGRRAQA